MVSPTRQRSVASKTAFRRLEFVSSGQKRRKFSGLNLMTSRKNSPSLRGGSAITQSGRGDFQSVVGEVGKRKRVEHAAAVRAGIGAHAQIAARRELLRVRE